MPRVTRLPPLTREHGMLRDDSPSLRENRQTVYRQRRRRTSFHTSDPKSDNEPIDCILVYNKDADRDDSDRSDSEHYVKPSDRRQKFEKYLVEKQNLKLKRLPSNSAKVGYIKVHTPFRELFSTAEKVRMRLPIEEIKPNDDYSPPPEQSGWERFKARCKNIFRLDASLNRDEPDYYTAMYSSKISKFRTLFEKFHGANQSYFTPAQRSLLTHELLTKAHAGEKEADGDVQPESTIAQGVLASANGLPKGTGRSGIDRLISKKAYIRYFPLHEPLRNDKTLPESEWNDREKLTKYWATMRKCLKFQPLWLVRSYMGEKVAFYFALCGFYNQTLILPAIVGLIVFIYGASTVATDEPTSAICGSYGQSTDMCPRCDITCPFWKLSDSCVYSKISYVFDNAATVVFAVFMSLWARWFVEFWKRRQAVLQYEWDSMDFEEHLEPIRPTFERSTTVTRVNPVTEIEEPHVRTRKRVPYFLLAIAVVTITVLIVCGTIFGTIVYRVQLDYILKSTSVKTYSSIIITVTTAAINLICTLILSLLYYWLARKITDLEMHKYQSKYDDSLIIKIYLFQFANFYSSLFYIAFFKGRFIEYPSKYGEPRTGDFTEQCDPAGCLVELSIQFVVIMIGNQIINNIVEFFFAIRRTCRRWFSRSNGDGKALWEIDNDLLDFDTLVLIDEYLELVIQFGFVTLFVVAFPLAPLFALCNNLIELRLDAWKLLSKYKRPIPFKASDIGIWSDILSAISYLAVLTNAIVIAWTSEFIPKMTFRVLQSSGTSLSGYVNWTLSSFPISDYNSTGRMPPDVPPGLIACRYRDFRESTAPSYSLTIVYWNTIAARLAFIVVFEHVIFFIVYIIQRLVADVPKTIRHKIDRERYIDQCERWASAADPKTVDRANSKPRGPAPVSTLSTARPTVNDGRRRITGKRRIGIRIVPINHQ